MVEPRTAAVQVEFVGTQPVETRLKKGLARLERVEPRRKMRRGERTTQSIAVGLAIAFTITSQWGCAVQVEILSDRPDTHISVNDDYKGVAPVSVELSLPALGNISSYHIEAWTSSDETAYEFLSSSDPGGLPSRVMMRPRGMRALTPEERAVVLNWLLNRSIPRIP